MRRQSIADTDTSKNDYSALDFSEFVDGSDANKGKLGLFILRVAGAEGRRRTAATISRMAVLYRIRKSIRSHRPEGTDANGNPNDPAERADILADRRLILVTDLGLLVKDNADGTHDVFVQSIKTGEPVGGAQVDVLGKNGIPVVSVKTDDTGRADVAVAAAISRAKSSRSPTWCGATTMSRSCPLAARTAS